MLVNFLLSHAAYDVLSISENERGDLDDEISDEDIQRVGSR